MSTFESLKKSYEFNRGRTLATLDEIDKLPDPQAALAFRLGPGRAHIAWQFMHIGVTEEIFATERLAPERKPQWTELWSRFRGGSKADDNVPTSAQIREVLSGARARMLETLANYGDDRLGEIPPPLADRKLTVRDVFNIISWHEGHHQGQAHAMLNTFRATRQ